MLGGTVGVWSELLIFFFAWARRFATRAGPATHTISQDIHAQNVVQSE